MDVIKAIDAIKKGNLVIVADDNKRENEGDLIASAELITTEQVNFMIKEARGLMCVSLTNERCKELDLQQMVNDNTSLNNTQFTVSVDLISDEITTGVSAFDRACTIHALVDPNKKPHDFGRPGHIFPLIANPGGVLQRPGHTEAALQLCQLAGLKDGAVLIEIINEDGKMARYPDLLRFAEKHDFEIITVRALQEYLSTHSR